MCLRLADSPPLARVSTSAMSSPRGFRFGDPETRVHVSRGWCRLVSRVVLAPRTTRRSSIDARGVVDDRVCELVRSRGQDARVSVCTGRRTPPRPRPVGFFSQPEMDRVGASANAASRAAPTPLTRVPKMSRIFSSVIQNALAFRARSRRPLSFLVVFPPFLRRRHAARPRPLENPIDDVEEVRGGRVRLRGEKHRPPR